MKRNIYTIAAALAIVFCGTVSAERAERTEVCHVLAFGVNNSEKSTRTPDKVLQYAGKNVQDFAECWRNQEGSQFARVDTDVRLDARCKEILTALDDLALRAKPGETAHVMFSGHGGRQANDWLYEAYDEYLPMAPVRKRLQTLAAQGVHVFLWVDTCHAGAVMRRDNNFVVLASSLAFQSSWEIGRWTNNLFTVAVKQALAGRADLNGDGMITLGELEDYLERRTDELNGNVQLPRRQQATFRRPAAVKRDTVVALVRSTVASDDEGGRVR